MGLALEEPQEKDYVVAKDGARVYFQSHIANAYDGAEFDWEDDMWGGGFTFKHPDMGEC